VKLITQDNLWFTEGRPPHPERGANYWWHRTDTSMVSVEPLQGFTASDDQPAKLQELQWLQRYVGELVVAQEWIMPGDRIDRNLSGWLKLFNRHARDKDSFCIFYDPVLAVKHRFGEDLVPPFNFSNPQYRAMWNSDLDYLARYTRGRRYYRRNGQPVIYVWAAGYGITNADQAFLEAERRGLYILGDVFGGNRTPAAGIRGATGFVSQLPGGRSGPQRVTNLLPTFEREFRRWRERYDLVPAGSLAYDDEQFQRALGNSWFIRHYATAADMRQVLRTLARYASDAIYLGTTNNWAEGAHCLPTVEGGFERLEAIKQVLYPLHPIYTGPVATEVRARKITLLDADIRAEVAVTPPQKLKRDSSYVRPLKRLEKRVLRLRRGWRWVDITNLDGKDIRILPSGKQLHRANG